jgi:ubiquitin C-terminal hydrolase
VSKYLIFHLRRFKEGGFGKIKNHALIKFPFLLDLSQFVISPGAPETYFINDKREGLKKPDYWKGPDQSKSTQYKLYGVLNHSGTMEGGHYYSYIEDKGQWYRCNDSDFGQMSNKDIVTRNAYVLFYKRQ